MIFVDAVNIAINVLHSRDSVVRTIKQYPFKKKKGLLLLRNGKIP